MQQPIKLTKNEKLALKFLIKDGRISDVDISKKLRITTQAVGKIRRKLETIGIIRGYSTNIDYGRIGVNTFALVVMRLTLKSWEELGELGIEKLVLKNPHIVNIYRIPEGSATHVGLYGFRDLDELDRFFHIMQTSSAYNQYVELKKIYVFSNHSLIKDSPAQLICKVIDEMGKERINAKPLPFVEIDRFGNKVSGKNSF
ncbi:MAG: Lrp/AsnC family transcriptional regulator [Nanoarchaeota archaeon]|nr:Lrp/AsnC family transcriptional regulator [Nanoarchaeota archaeon]